MSPSERKFLILVIAIFVAAGLETDIYLPAFPDMMVYFRANEAQIQQLLTWNFMGICISGPLYGPLSDTLGRRPPLLTALGLFFAGSLITLFAQRFDLMLVGRVLQGVGSGGCFTLGTALIFDAFQAERAIVAINYLNSVFPFIMAGAPALGGALNHAFGFRANFVAVAVLVAFSFAAAIFFFVETLPAAQRRPWDTRQLVRDYATVLRSTPFWLLTLSMCLLFSLWIAFLSTISVLFVLELGVPKERFPLFQSVPLVAWVVASLTSARGIRRLGAARLKAWGTGVMVAGCVLFPVGAWLAPRNPYVHTTCMVLYAFGLNWFQGLYFPAVMELYPDIKGVTSSLLTSARLLIASAVVGLTGGLYDGTIFPVAWAMVAVAVVAAPMMIVYERRYAGEISLDPTAAPVH
jgi:DHA1 family bicyclomycin/chloramphenicol resistance-like MFS transporter